MQTKKKKKIISEGKKDGRPKIEIDWKIFEVACNLLATKDELCGILNMSEDTLSRRVKEKYGVTFAEYIKKSGAMAKVSLRRNQFHLSKTSAAMAIFLGKNYLGQQDNQGVVIQEMPKIVIGVKDA